MEARDIYNVMRSIAEPIHAYSDQMVAIAKWIEAEFEYKPVGPAVKLNAAAPDLLQSCIDVVKWADDLGYYNDFTNVRLAIKKATE